jgi:hypothetical protein
MQPRWDCNDSADADPDDRPDTDPDGTGGGSADIGSLAPLATWYVGHGVFRR